jgi:hypothetical protein
MQLSIILSIILFHLAFASSSPNLEGFSAGTLWAQVLK